MASVLEREFNLRRGKPIGLHAFASWLRGETLPEVTRLKTLAEWLNVPVSELVSEETAYKLERIEEKKSQVSIFGKKLRAIKIKR